MNRKIYHFLIGISFLQFSCNSGEQQTSEAEDIRSAFKLAREAVETELKLPAELLPYEKAEIHTKLDAYVQRVLVDIGDKVKKGQVLVTLDAPEIKSKTAEANTKLLEAEAKYRASEDRYIRILNASKTQGAISEADIIALKNTYQADSAFLQAAKLMAQSYREQQDYLNIRAPFDGIITSRDVDAGDFVNQNQNRTMLTLERPDRLRLRVHVPEAYVQTAPDSEILSFTTDGLSNRAFEAKLARKSGSINPQTRTEIWEYEFDNKEGVLKPGMYAMVALLLNRAEDSFVVPAAAVATTLEKKFVIRVKDGIMEWVDVRTGISKNSKTEIFGELNTGDILLSRASDELKQGQKIEYTVD
ncbi:efflux RND transporter periplasmic adaptor subunit [Cecembia lonarensis]|uniref:Cation efflux system protein CusB n=1 Tax=Cecembia lonarensis (strain CCUG 58316 / KCTC 22772 / LW9) TaxID=1225176 RepID=K1LDN8_CECL9|nr:efflux RND transporter periplasmic adaptor subunit [Cecembia lonarensis]EKB48513.1 Cation efflux system protein CusB precursor [Cecembia lonarensis LW9]